MPSYVHAIVIDWSYPDLTLEEQGIVRGYEARLRAEPHTADDLENTLVLASRALSGRPIVVEYTNEDDEPFGFVLRDGALTDEELDPDDSGTYTGALDAADYAAGGVTRVYLALYWPESLLEALSAEAARQDRSWSALTQRVLELDDDPETSSWPRHTFAAPSSARMRKQSVYLPTDRMFELQVRAAAADCSMSTLLRQAFERCWHRLVHDGSPPSGIR